MRPLTRRKVRAFACAAVRDALHAERALRFEPPSDVVCEDDHNKHYHLDLGTMTEAHTNTSRTLFTRWAPRPKIHALGRSETM